METIGCLWVAYANCVKGERNHFCILLTSLNKKWKAQARTSVAENWVFAVWQWCALVKAINQNVYKPRLVLIRHPLLQGDWRPIPCLAQQIGKCVEQYMSKHMIFTYYLKINLCLCAWVFCQHCIYVQHVHAIPMRARRRCQVL